MYLSGGHKTVKNILKRGAFTVSMGDAEHAAACDYVGIVNVSVDERALDENGKLAVEKLHVITFDYANHGYYVLGEKVASAFEDGEKFK